jgi:hypothetical protein
MTERLDTKPEIRFGIAKTNEEKRMEKNDS